MSSEMVPLSEFCTVRKGLSYKGEFIHQKGPALLGIGTIKEGGGFRPENIRTYGGPYKKEHVLYPGDVYVALTSQDGFLIGSPAKVPKNFHGFGITTHHDAKIDWNIDDPMIRDFFFWVMHSFQFITHCQNFSVGTTVYATHAKDVERFLVPKLLTSKQMLATNTLNNISAIMSINDKKIKTLEVQIETLFRSWFIDFDPVKAKAEGKLSYGMDEVTAALFPDTFEDSDFGPIPTGWRVGTISEFGKIVTGRTPSSKNPEHFGGPVPFITIPDLARNIWQEETERTISQEGATSLKSALIPPDSVCVSCIATVGNVGITTRPSITNQQIHSIVCNKGYSSQFVYSLITSFVPNLKFFAGGGAVVQNISKSTFGKQRVIIPPIQVVEQFTRLVEPLYQSIKAKNSASRSILETRDALLPRLMSGELKLN